MPEMQALKVSKPDHNPGAAGELKTVPVPEPKNAEVLVKLLLRPVNPADVFTLMGVYKGAAPADQWQEHPLTPGLDGMGVVEKLGPGASKFAVGQRVAIAGFPVEIGNGSWQEYAAYPEDDLAAVPDSVSDEEAAQFWVNPVTVYGMLQSLDLLKGAYVVFSAAGSALSRMGIHLAKHFGLKTIGIVRRDEQREEVLQHGADAAVSSASEDVVARIKEITGGEGAAGGIDSVGGETLNQIVQSLKPDATVLVYGAMSGFTAQVDLISLLFNTITVKGFWLSPYIKHMSAEQKAKVIDAVMGLIEQKVIQPGGFVGKLFPLTQIAEAIAESTKDGRGGKVFLDSR